MHAARSCASNAPFPACAAAARRCTKVGVYDNPTGHAIPRGGMVHMAVMFAPDRPAAWPAPDPSDPEYRRDVERLEARGQRDAVAHEH
jgi:cytochrome P450